MFRFISSKKYKELTNTAAHLSDYESITTQLSDLEARYDALRNELDECERLLEVRDSEATKLRDAVDTLHSEEHNYVKLVFSNDLQKITPFIGNRPDCFESLFQEGLLKDGQEGSDHAIQLALMFLASDGLVQILEAFEETPSED